MIAIRYFFVIVLLIYVEIYRISSSKQIANIEQNRIFFSAFSLPSYVRLHSVFVFTNTRKRRGKKNIKQKQTRLTNKDERKRREKEEKNEIEIVTCSKWIGSVSDNDIS